MGGIELVTLETAALHPAVLHGKARSFIDIKQDWKGVTMLTTNPCMNVTLHSHGKKKIKQLHPNYVYV